MNAQISAVNMDSESGNLINITVSDGNSVVEDINHLYKQECNHGTCLVFP